MNDKELRRACERELKYVKKAEREMQQKAMEPHSPWKAVLGGAIPERVHDSLQAAYAKAFEIIFENAVGVIELTYNKSDIEKDFIIHNFAVDTKRSQDELKRIRRKAESSDFFNSIFTTVEGVGLGVLGIGLPDIVIFLGFILKSVYETAIKYGYDYEKPEERLFILRLMSASVRRRDKWIEADMEIDEMLSAYARGKGLPVPMRDDMQEQIETTAEDFAMDMLVLKFIQGLPLVGVLGGMGNPIYYKKILQYVRVKYYKRYLLEKMK